MEDPLEILRRHDLVDEPGLTVIQKPRGQRLPPARMHRLLAIDEFTKHERFQVDGFVVTDWPSYFTIDWDETLQAGMVHYVAGPPETELDDLLEGIIDPLS